MSEIESALQSTILAYERQRPAQMREFTNLSPRESEAEIRLYLQFKLIGEPRCSEGPVSELHLRYAMKGSFGQSCDTKPSDGFLLIVDWLCGQLD